MILFPPTVEIEEKPSAIASGFPAIAAIAWSPTERAYFETI